ncbi:hypothetical protein RHMOL_Rhmol11G0082300 [Rhododendron molle]|uniref:Uncharacterized protein n=1 Tax=Rhododendron molle TaxID=49168 RepID=A0ACC0LQ32_RHOML|nr:hypothetical protein RHMOL_Rhmol11G0082300 [Rhododendron molle]
MSAPTAPAPPSRSFGDGDVMGLLLRERIVLLGYEINDYVAECVISQLLLLDAQDPTKDIKLFINSPGGSLRDWNKAYMMVGYWLGALGSASAKQGQAFGSLQCVSKLDIVLDGKRRMKPGKALGPDGFPIEEHLGAPRLTVGAWRGSRQGDLRPRRPSATMALYDVLRLVRADVSTVAMGLAADTASIILGGGTKGKRLAMPNARIMMHQPMGGASGEAFNMVIQTKELMESKASVIKIISNFTGQTLEQVEKDIEYDRYMSPIEAVEYGIIDGIIDRDSIVPLMPARDERFSNKFSDILDNPELDVPDDEIY